MSRSIPASCLQDASVPQAWFWHFYLTGALVNGMLLVEHVLQEGMDRQVRRCAGD